MITLILGDPPVVSSNTFQTLLDVFGSKSQKGGSRDAG